MTIRHILPGLVLASLLSAPAAQSQGALIKRNRLAAAPLVERITFSDTRPTDGETGSPIKSIQQVAFPVSATFAFGSRVSVDVGAAYTAGTVEYDDGETLTLNGISDVRVRASAKLLGDGLILSLGANVPAGLTSLDDDQLTAVRVLAAPAFGLQLPSIGFGPAGSVGLVATRPLGQWIGALGVSYEYRGTFSPVAALQAGAEPDFDPGNSTHVTAGLEGFLGDSRLTLQVTGDVYSDDILTVGGTSTQSIKLGPTITAQGAIAFGGGAIRDGRLHAAVRHRAALTRDGATVDGSDGIYLGGGIEGGLAMGRTFDLHIAADALSHSGLELDDSLMTAKASSVGVLVGIRARGAAGIFEPFVRAGTGSVDPGSGSATFTSLSAGVSLVLRF